MPTPEPPKIARPAGQQPPESGGIPGPTVSADPPSSSSSNPAPPGVTNGLAPAAPLVNGGAGNPSGERPAASVPASAVPASGISPTSNTSTSFPPALKVVLLPDHLRQNQAGPSTGGQPRPSTGAGGPLPSPASPAMMKTVAVTIGNPLPVARASTATVQRITVSSKTPQLNQTTVPLLQNFQVPAGMVLVRSDSGQLVLVPQKVIAQAKARAQVHGTGNTSSAATISAPTVRISTVQATGTHRVLNQVKPPTVQHMNQLQAGVQTSAAAQRITVVQPQTMSGTIAPKSVSTVAQKQASASADHSATVPVVQTSASPETLENVKKCKNFLATLIKLASSGSHSPQMSNNVKALVQKLLDGMMEVEEFTNQLYKELKSSPQPYLVPFLKRSLPALRKLMPNSQAFIQQCLQKPAAPAATLAAVSGASKQANPGQVTKTITVTSATQQAKVLQSLSSPQMATQQSGVLTKSQASMLPRTQTVTLQRPPNHVIPPSQNQVKEVQTSAATSVTKVTLAQMNRNVLLQASSGQIIKKEFGGSTFRDEDDINDVASMAGVNITEENARILATNSELVGAIIRSCKDEAFLSSVSLQKKTLEIGKKHGVTEVNSDVLSTISHATQEHLRELVEKLTVIAQHRMMTHKDDDRYSLLNDTRSQLKFFEQLDQLEKQRKDEDERETMLRLAKSRAKHEDPEQLRLKQRAKEMQQLELAQLQQREANLAALAAIGPRKRKTPDSPGLRTGNEGLSSSGGALGLRATQARPYLRQRVTRVNLRDLILCLEQDQAMKHSLFLYRAYLK